LDLIFRIHLESFEDFENMIYRIIFFIFEKSNIQGEEIKKHTYRSSHKLKHLEYLKESNQKPKIQLQSSKPQIETDIWSKICNLYPNLLVFNTFLRNSI